MQYMGGKSRIAKFITPHLVRHGRPVWDPFAGGLSISAALHVAGATVLTSDVRIGLIRLYEMCLAGDWSATADCSREEFDALKRVRDPKCPRTAFVLSAYTFGADPFGGYAGLVSKQGQDYGQCARNLLAKKLATSERWSFEAMSFFDLAPQPGLVVYCDPPYRGTHRYETPFDFDAFDARVLEWARFGPVYVSEYAFPRGRVVWERASTSTIAAGAGRAKAHTERLYEVAA